MAALNMQRSTGDTVVVSAIGGIVYDLMIVVDKVADHGRAVEAHSVVPSCGGKAANAAVAVYKASHVDPGLNEDQVKQLYESEQIIQVCLVGLIGDDAFGDFCRGAVAKLGVDTTGVKKVRGRQTGVASVIVESSTGQNRIHLDKGANMLLQPEDFLSLESLGGVDKPQMVMTSLETPLAVVTQIHETATRFGIETLFNPAPAGVMVPAHTFTKVVHLLLNEVEALVLCRAHGMDISMEESGFHLPRTEKMAKHFLDLGVRYVVITLDAEGAFYAAFGQQSGHVPAETAIRSVDPTGAGDSFLGFYVVAYLNRDRSQHWDMASAVRRACRAGARAIGEVGAQTAMPWRNEV